MSGVNADVAGFGSIRNGRLFIENRRAFDEAIRRFRDGAQVQIEVTARRATRSIPQNAWYWGVIVQAIAEHTGYTPDELHDVLKMKFIPKRLAVCDGNGEVKDEFVVGGSTRKMTTAEFGEYCDAIRQWAAQDLGIDIPDPHETPLALAGHGWGV